MLSDTIFEAISKLYEEIRYYSQPPFSYGIQYKSHFINALANLYFILCELDGRHTTMSRCIKFATKEYDRAYNPDINCDDYEFGVV
jgi:hypothetical protein